MDAVLTAAGIIAGALLVTALVLRSWRWRCPTCGRRRLRFVGLASEWSAGWVESPFPEGRCVRPVRGPPRWRARPLGAGKAGRIKRCTCPED